MAYPTQGQSPWGDDLKDYIDTQDAATLAAAIAPVTSTTSALAAIGNAINTTGKATGKQVFNTTTSKPVWAVGSTAGSVWVDATGATAHTPA